MKAPGYWGKIKGMSSSAWRHHAIVYAAAMDSAEAEMKWLIFKKIKYKAKAIVQFDRTLNGRA